MFHVLSMGQCHRIKSKKDLQQLSLIQILWDLRNVFVQRTFPWIHTSDIAVRLSGMITWFERCGSET